MSRLRSLLVPLLAALPVLALLLDARHLASATHALETRPCWRALPESERLPPAPLGETPEPFARVSVRGRFLHDREALVGAEVRGNLLGARLVTPLERPGAPSLLVDRGWVPLHPRDPVARPDGPVEVVGYIHPGDRPGLMAAVDDPPTVASTRSIPPASPRPWVSPRRSAYALVALADPTAEARSARPAAASCRAQRTHTSAMRSPGTAWLCRCASSSSPSRSAV